MSAVFLRKPCIRPPIKNHTPLTSLRFPSRPLLAFSRLTRCEGEGADSVMTDTLRDDEEGAIQIGATDRGMVRFIVTTRSGVLELDFDAEEADEIAEELRAAADKARLAQNSKR